MYWLLVHTVEYLHVFVSIHFYSLYEYNIFVSSQIHMHDSQYCIQGKSIKRVCRSYKTLYVCVCVCLCADKFTATSNISIVVSIHVAHSDEWLFPRLFFIRHDSCVGWYFSSKWLLLDVGVAFAVESTTNSLSINFSHFTVRHIPRKFFGCLLSHTNSCARVDTFFLCAHENINIYSITCHMSEQHILVRGSYKDNIFHPNVVNVMDGVFSHMLAWHLFFAFFNLA